MRYLSRRIMVPFEASKLPMENKYQEALNFPWEFNKFHIHSGFVLFIDIGHSLVNLNADVLTDYK
jgi:hypothetical protein